jgi:hypothetical protein
MFETGLQLTYSYGEKKAMAVRDSESVHMKVVACVSASGNNCKGK